MLLEKYINDFMVKTKKSNSLWDKAKTMLPGGVAGSAGFLAPRPIYIKKASGGKIIDVDGNEYIDLLLGGFPNILGHSPKEITGPVRKQIDMGTSYMLFQETGIKLVQKIQKHLPHLEMLRFANSGTEATMFAIRVARSWTKKEKVAKPEGGYNGQHDYVLISGASGRNAGTDRKPVSAADCAGIPHFILDNTVVFPWNDINATISIIEENASELAAVIIEPINGFGIGALPLEKTYLQALREVTEKYKILLIFDEIITGFRLGGMGGAVNYFGIKPDLACYGKAITGGFPIGAFGGRKDIMEKTLSPEASPEYKVFQSGTFTGNAVAMASGLACLSELEKKDYSYIDNLALKLRKGLQQIAAEKGFQVQVTGVSSLFYPHFNKNPIKNMRDKLKDDSEKNRTLCMGLILNGVYLPPGHAGATCFSHTQKDIDYVLGVAERVLEQMKQEN